MQEKHYSKYCIVNCNNYTKSSQYHRTEPNKTKDWLDVKTQLGTNANAQIN